MAKTISFVVGGLVLLVAVSVGAQQSQPSVKGVWRVVEQTINDRTLKDSQLGVGYHVYTDGFFAVVRESDVPPRPNVTDVENATAAQLLSVWGPFVAQFGTYEVKGDQITERTLVAKNPSNMSGSGSTRRFRIEGNTLITEPLQQKPGARSITLKMVRVE